MDSFHQQTNPMSAKKTLRNSLGWYGLYLLLSLILFFPSYTLWFSEKFDIISHEFDYFIGQYPGFFSNYPAARLLVGKIFAAMGWLLVGTAYWKSIQSLGKVELPRFIVVILVLIPSLLYMAGLPWISPDVFYYIRGGWIESGYGYNPFAHAATEIPGYLSDPMFVNTYAPFLDFVGNYGPLFQKFCASVTYVSEGNIKISLFAFKGICLLAHAGGILVITQLAAQSGVSAVRHVALIYGSNPLVLFTTLSCAHNDGIMMLPVLLAVWTVINGRPILAGTFLASAFAIKFIPLLILPVFLLFLLKKERPFYHLVIFLGAFLLTCIPLFSMYSESWKIFQTLAQNGLLIHRSSFYTTLYPLLKFLGLGGVLSWLSLGLFFAFSAFLLGKRFFLKGTIDSAEFQLLILKIFLVYLLLASAVVAEWYLIWILPFAFYLQQSVGRRFLWLLTLFSMVCMVFVVKTYPQLMSLAQVMQYFLLLYTGLLVLYPQLFARSYFFKLPKSDSEQ
jgi:hypothetical protein